MEYSAKQASRLIEKFLEHEIGNKEKLDSIKNKIENNSYLSDSDTDYIREKHDQLIAIDDEERKIKESLDSIDKLLEAEVGNTLRLKEIKEIFENGNMLTKYDDQYLQEKLDDLEKIQDQNTSQENVTSEPDETDSNAKMYKIERSRPTGVTVLAILYIIGGIAGLIGAASFQGLATMMGSSMAGSSMMGVGIFQAMGGFIATIFAITSVISFIIAWGLLSARSWGRLVVIVFTIVSLIMESVSLVGANFFAIVGIVLDLVVLYYMWRPHVINYFEGKRYEY